MIDKIKYFTKLSSLALLSFLKIAIFGSLSAALSFAIGLILLLAQINAEPLKIFAVAPVQSVLLILVIFSPFLIISFSGSYSIKKIINKIVQDKSESTLYPLLDKVIVKLKANQHTRVIEKGMDYSLIKLQLIDSAKNESENKWIRRALIYGFKKLKIDDIDFNENNLDMYEVIKLKTIQGLKEISKPAMRNFWLIIGFHWLVVLIIIFMR